MRAPGAPASRARLGPRSLAVLAPLALFSLGASCSCGPRVAGDLTGLRAVVRWDPAALDLDQIRFSGWLAADPLQSAFDPGTLPAAAAPLESGEEDAVILLPDSLADEPLVLRAEGLTAGATVALGEATATVLLGEILEVVVVLAPPADCAGGAPDGTPCDDGDPLTTGDACTGGVCAGTPPADTEGPAGDPTCEDGADNDADGLTDLLDPDCGCFLVTTLADEINPGESAAPPHLGAGLSLREAILLANGAPGPDCLAFSVAGTIDLASNLPPLADGAGLTLEGGGTVGLRGVALMSMDRIGIDLDSSNNVVRGLELSYFLGGMINAAVRIRPGANLNVVRDCVIHDVMGPGVRAFGGFNAIGPGNDISIVGSGVLVNANGNLVTGNRIHDTFLDGVRVIMAASFTEIALNEIWNAGGDGIFVETASTGTVIRHDTIHFSAGHGINLATTATATVVENVLLTGNTEWGMEAAMASFAALGNVGYWMNGLGGCWSCDDVTGAVTDDPLYVDAAAGDFALQPGSPAIDAGALTPLDVNGPAPGTFNGAAPDLGARESPPL